MMFLFMSLGLFIVFLFILLNNNYNLFNFVWILLEMFFIISLLFMMMFFFWESSNGIFMIFSSGLVMDKLSCLLCCLSIFMIYVMLLCSKNEYSLKDISFIMVIIFLMLFTIISFCSSNLLIFFIFFEGSIIPMVFLIMGWGKSPERMSSMYYFLFYTLFGSVPLLISLLCIDFLFSTLDFIYLNNLIFNQNSSIYLDILGLMMFISFLIKAPIYGVHFWLPKAHVEAPVSGSVFLAAILLKLGGYGFIRTYFILISSIMNMSSIFIVIFLMGAVFSALICLGQSDIKKLIAYSSVSHMGLVFSGLFTMTQQGINGGVMVMLSHGFTSSGLFIAAYIIQERSQSREMPLSKGLVFTMPMLSTCFFGLTLLNMSAPPSLGLSGELSLFSSLFSWDLSLMILIIFYVFFGSYYSIRLFQEVQMGLGSNIYSFKPMSVHEIYLMFIHLIPSNILIFSIMIFSF